VAKTRQITKLACYRRQFLDQTPALFPLKTFKSMNQYKMQILQLVFHTVLLVREPTIEILDFGVNEKAFSVSFVAEYDIQG